MIGDAADSVFRMAICCTRQPQLSLVHCIPYYWTWSTTYYICCQRHWLSCFPGMRLWVLNHTAALWMSIPGPKINKEFHFKFKQREVSYLLLVCTSRHGGHVDGVLVRTNRGSVSSVGRACWLQSGRSRVRFLGPDQYSGSWNNREMKVLSLHCNRLDLRAARMTT